MVSEVFDNGINTGDYRGFHENGQLRELGFYRQSKRNGEWKFYNRQGKLYKIYTFHDGELVDTVLYD